MKRVKKPSSLSFALLFLSILFLGLVQAREVPRLTGPVVDEANIFSSRYEKALGRHLQDYYKQTGHQFQVLAVKSLEDESLEGFSIKVTDKWKLGKKSTDKGLLLLLAIKERKVRVEVGQGLEGDIPDIRAQDAIRIMRPYLKAQDYQGATYSALESLASFTGKPFATVKSSKDRGPRRQRQKKSFPLWMIPILLLMLSTRFGRMMLFSMLLSGGRSRGGFSSGGGSWSGGGGGFSGGGASGDW